MTMVAERSQTHATPTPQSRDAILASSLAFAGPRPRNLTWLDKENGLEYLGYDETHNDHVLRIKQMIRRNVLRAIDHGVFRFYTGMAEGYDTWAAEIVISLKPHHPNILLCAAVPFLQQADPWTPESRERWRKILRQCDKVWLTGGLGIPSGGRAFDADDWNFVEEERRERPVIPFSDTVRWLMARNRWMIDRAHYLLSAWSGQTGGTRSAIEYAAKKNRHVICYDYVQKTWADVPVMLLNSRSAPAAH